MGDLGYGKRVSLEVEGDGAVKIEGVWVPVWVAAKRDHGCGKAVPCKVEGERIAAQGSFRDGAGVSFEIEGEGAGMSFEIEGVLFAAKRGHGCSKAVPCKVEGERIAAQGSFRDRAGVSLEIEGDGAGVSFEIEGVWVAAK